MLGQIFKLKASKQYIALIAVTFICSDLVILALTLASWLKLGLLVAVTIYGLHTLFQYGLLLNQTSVICLRYLGDKSWILETKTQSFSVELVGDSAVTPYVSVLRFRRRDKVWPISCVVFRDSLESGLYQSLITALSDSK